MLSWNRLKICSWATTRILLHSTLRNFSTFELRQWVRICWATIWCWNKIKYHCFNYFRDQRMNSVEFLSSGSSKPMKNFNFLFSKGMSKIVSRKFQWKGKISDWRELVNNGATICLALGTKKLLRIGRKTCLKTFTTNHSWEKTNVLREKFSRREKRWKK